jgi:hypothetical protein
MPPLPPIRANLTHDGLSLDHDRLFRALDSLPAGAPVVALVHGYSFSPGLGRDCPHRPILALDPDVADAKAISWPRHLGLDGRRGLAIAFGWHARGNLWQAHANAARAGAALAELAGILRARGRCLDVVAHSLGARVALAALHEAGAGDLRHLILLAGAEARGLALAALDSPAGRAASIVNVATRENDLFDACFEWLVHGGMRTSIGQGLGQTRPNWRDLWIDSPLTLGALSRMGHEVSPACKRVSHWSPYLRPGVLAVYRAVLSGDLPVSALPQPSPSRRWSRLVAVRSSVVTA